jgi:hypothetical protein
MLLEEPHIQFLPNQCSSGPLLRMAYVVPAISAVLRNRICGSFAVCRFDWLCRCAQITPSVPLPGSRRLLGFDLRPHLCNLANMSSQPFLEHDLLSYNSTYRILICRQCKYAIQKSAVQSHLLRHKIYRHQRQNLLRAVAELPLLNPGEVLCPSSTAPRLSELPVVEGLRCVVDECKHLCASDKRMKRHLADEHGREGSKGLRDLTRPAKIQTFFRGTQIHYFEVEGPQILAVASSNHANRREINSPILAQRSWVGQERTSSSSSKGVIEIEQPSEVRIDLETLSDYHHYITITSPTLPIPQATTYGSSPWQNTIANNALRWGWLMSGLLAISAWHEAFLDPDADVKGPHMVSGRQRSKAFYHGLNEWGADSAATSDPQVVQVVKQVQSMLVLAASAVMGTHALKRLEPSWSSDWQCIRQNICCILRLDEHRSSSFGDANSRTSAFGGDAVFHFEECALGKTTPVHSAPISRLATRLQKLPSEMTRALKKPDPGTLSDVLATISAIETLSEIINDFIRSSEMNPHEALQGVARWIVETPEHFHKMIIDRKSAASVVLMHWVVLVEEAVHSGCWYMSAIARDVRKHADTILGQCDETTKKLTSGL